MSEAQEIHYLLKTSSNMTLGEYSGSTRLLNAFTMSGPKTLSKSDLSELGTLASQIMKVLEIFHRHNQPYNLLIRDNIVHIIPR